MVAQEELGLAIDHLLAGERLVVINVDSLECLNILLALLLGESLAGQVCLHGVTELGVGSVDLEVLTRCLSFGLLLELLLFGCPPFGWRLFLEPRGLEGSLGRGSLFGIAIKAICNEGLAFI